MVPSARWENWSRTDLARPVRVVSPADTDEVVAVVKAAADARLRVKAVGAGHSAGGVAVADGVLLRTERLRGLVAADPATGLVSVRAGTRLAALNRELAGRGLALSNMGDADVFTLAGAISTGTHGTGARLRGLSSAVQALELVLSDGSVVTCSDEERPDLFAAARLGLGALGVIIAVTIRCEPAFLLRAVEAPMPLDAVLADLDRLAGDNDHFEFFWFPYAEQALTKRHNRVPAGTPPRPLSRFRRWLDDEFLSNDVYEVVNRLATRVPRAVPAMNRLSSRLLSPCEYVDGSYRVLVDSPRRVMFREMEYAVPRAAVVAAITEIRRWADRSREPLPFPVQVRFAAGDDVWLSTAHQRDSAYVAVHQYHRLPHERFFAAAERILVAVGGRPHWGKLHGLGADRLRELYPRFGDFLAVRDQVDPQRVFGNAYLERVLGP
jgi:L-gulono-1,4-lactone dehydrogenase